MARFTDETKWSDKWFRSLKPSHKLVWMYLCDNCDIAGFYELDADYVAFHTGLSSDEVSAAIVGLSRGYLGAKGSDYIWIKNFLKHQKNHILNSSNNCHRGIIKRIQDKLSYFPSIPEILGADEGLFSPTGKGKGKGKGKTARVFVAPTLEEYKSYFQEHGYSLDTAVTSFRGYSEADWIDTRGNKIKNWKQKVNNVWFKEENKAVDKSASPFLKGMN
jgi:hypothetical protein